MQVNARVVKPDQPVGLTCRVSRDPEGRWVLAIDGAPAGAELLVRVTVEGADGLGGQWTALDSGISMAGTGSEHDPLMLTVAAPPTDEERVMTVQGLPGPIVLVVRVRAISVPAPMSATDSGATAQTGATEAPPFPPQPAPSPPVQPDPEPEATAQPAVPEAGPEPTPGVAQEPSVGRVQEATAPGPVAGAASVADPARSGAPFGWVALGALATAVVSLLVWSLTRPAPEPVAQPLEPAVESVTVPDVAGTPWDSAKRELEREGLQAFRAENRNDDSAAEGVVIAQRPPAGQTLATGSRVDLVVSLGSATVSVPDVIGMSLSDAQNALEATGGLDGVCDETRPSDRYEPGAVMAQVPESGRRVAAGSVVSLTTSAGPAPPPPSGLTTFTNTDQGYSINYPAAWRVERSSYQDGGTYHRVEFIAPQEDVRALVDSGSPGNSDDPLDSWRYLSRQMAQTYGSRYHLISLAHTTLSGYRAGYWEFDLDLESGTTVRKIDVGINVAGRGHAVLCRAPVEDFAAYEDLFQGIIDSFEVR